MVDRKYTQLSFIYLIKSWKKKAFDSSNLDFLNWQHGGDVNATDQTGQTALHWSAVRGAIQASEVLLQEGARVNVADMNGYQVGLIFFLQILTILVLSKILIFFKKYFIWNSEVRISLFIPKKKVVLDLLLEDIIDVMMH